MRRLPIHRHPNPSPATWVIEEDKFLQRRWIKLPVSAKLQRNHGHPLRFSRCVDAESVRFAFSHPYRSILDRCQEEKYSAENQREQRQAGGIRDTADIPTLAPSPHGGVENFFGHRNCN